MIHRDISGLSRTRSCDLRWTPKLGMHYPSIRTNHTEEESTRHELCDRSCCLLSYNTFIIRRRVLPRPRTTRHKNRLHLHLRPGVVPYISSTSLQHLFNISSTSQRAPINRMFHLTLRFPQHVRRQRPIRHSFIQFRGRPRRQHSCATHSPTWRARLPPSRIQSCTINSSASSCTRSTMPLGSCADKQPSSESGSKT